MHRTATNKGDFTIATPNTHASTWPRIGVNAPIVTAFPSATSAWESKADADELIEIAVAADELGFSHFTCSDHTAVPTDIAAARGGTYWEPLATLAFLAARTRRIRLLTKVLVLGYRHPLEIVKGYGTLDRLSGGRVMLGVGVGSLEREFELLGADFSGRGARADDSIKAIRAAWGNPFPVYSGEFVSFDGVQVAPTGLQVQVPILVGGRTVRSLRRAVELCDGWVPFSMTPEEIGKALGRFELPDGFSVMLTSPALDPIGEANAVVDHLARLTDAGATDISATIAAGSAEHYRDQLRALAELAGSAETTAGAP